MILFVQIVYVFVQVYQPEGSSASPHFSLTPLLWRTGEENVMEKEKLMGVKKQFKWRGESKGLVEANGGKIILYFPLSSDVQTLLLQKKIFFMSHLNTIDTTLKCSEVHSNSSQFVNKKIISLSF